MRNPTMDLLTAQLKRPIDPATAARAVHRDLAASRAQDSAPRAPSRKVTVYEMFGREVHAAAHGISALDSGSTNITIVIHSDGTERVTYSAIANTLDAVRTCLVGVPAEARMRPSSLAVYRDGCYDFTAAKMLLAEYNESSAWPKVNAERAAQLAITYVDAQWERICALAMVLGSSCGRVGDVGVRRFARVPQ